MKIQLLLITVLVLMSEFTIAQVEIDQTTPEQAVQSFFETFHAQDTTSMKMLIHDDVVVGTIAQSQTDTLLKVDDAQALYLSISSIPDSIKFKEELTEIKVQEEGLLAHVWTPYLFYVNEKITHGGVNSFTLINSGGDWKIIYLVDTRRRD